MWLEADCNITSGEALVRQFLHGMTFMKEELGVTCKYLWLPDVFGYSWALPQILKQCNIDTFMTIKISWNQFDHMPNDLFIWRGIDGSEVLAYFMTTPGLNQPEERFYVNYNDFMVPETVYGAWHRFQNKSISNEILVSYGYGDGGGGVTRDMLMSRRVMDQLPGFINVKPTRAADFFDRLHQRVENTSEYVHTWDGELYLECHRGTYTTQGYNKKMNRKMEFMLTSTEWLSSLQLLENGKYDAQTLHNGWEVVLRNQFHDIIPGSSIREVYIDSKKEYETLSDSLSTLQDTIFDTLSDAEKNTYTVFNPSSFDRDALVELDGADLVFTDCDGHCLEAQPITDGYLVRVPVAALGCAKIHLQKGSMPDTSMFDISLTEQRIDTPILYHSLGK